MLFQKRFSTSNAFLQNFEVRFQMTETTSQSKDYTNTPANSTTFLATYTGNERISGRITLVINMTRTIKGVPHCVIMVYAGGWFQDEATIKFKEVSEAFQFLSKGGMDFDLNGLFGGGGPGGMSDLNDLFKTFFDAMVRFTVVLLSVSGWTRMPTSLVGRINGFQPFFLESTSTLVSIWRNKWNIITDDSEFALFSPR